MLARRRGALVVMSSVAGCQGFPGLATYAATKAFLAVWAEGLWAELRNDGVDVLACVAGAVSTPGYAAAMVAGDAPGILPAERVVEVAMASLGRKPTVVPGRINALAVLLGHLAPRQVAIKMTAAGARRFGSVGR
jgi:short-subunit dehydrogenase